jgi:hypothetical protein
MALGGAIAYDSLLAYTFIDMVGYGHENSGYLSTMLRDDESFFGVDLQRDFAYLGAKGDGIFGHFKNKVYLIVDCMVDLAYLCMLVLITCKVMVHSISKLQTR